MKEPTIQSHIDIHCTGYTRAYSVYTQQQGSVSVKGDLKVFYPQNIGQDAQK